MATKDAVTLSAMFRSTPLQFAMVTLVPVLVASGQLANSYFNDLSYFVSVPFAIVLLVFAVVLTQHQFARYRRRQLERNG